MERSPTFTGARLAEQLTALAISREVPLAKLLRAVILVGSKLRIELV